jgi:hypothetical protein
MSDKNRRNHERGQRVRLHMSAREVDFPSGSKASAQGNDLEGLLADADAHEVKRADSVRKRQQGTDRRGRSRTALRRMIRQTYDTAESLGLDHPEIRSVFKPPYRGNNDRTLVAEARSVVNAAAQFTALFTESGLPPAFFAEMTAKADDLELAAAQQAEAVAESVTATAALEDIYRRIDEIVDRLDPIVRNKYADDPAKLAAWESASRLERAPRHQPGDDEDGDDDGDDNNTPPPANG